MNLLIPLQQAALYSEKKSLSVVLRLTSINAENINGVVQQNKMRIMGVLG